MAILLLKQILSLALLMACGFLLVKLKKELYKGISQRDLYNLTVARRWINQKRFSRMTEAKAAETEVKPKFTQHLAATTAAAGEHLAAMKKLM